MTNLSNKEIAKRLRGGRKKSIWNKFLDSKTVKQLYYCGKKAICEDEEKPSEIAPEQEDPELFNPRVEPIGSLQSVGSEETPENIYTAPPPAPPPPPPPNIEKAVSQLPISEVVKLNKKLNKGKNLTTTDKRTLKKEGLDLEELAAAVKAPKLRKASERTLAPKPDTRSLQERLFDELVEKVKQKEGEFVGEGIWKKKDLFCWFKTAKGRRFKVCVPPSRFNPFNPALSKVKAVKALKTKAKAKKKLGKKTTLVKKPSKKKPSKKVSAPLVETKGKKKPSKKVSTKKVSTKKKPSKKVSTKKVSTKKVSTKKVSTKKVSTKKKPSKKVSTPLVKTKGKKPAPKKPAPLVKTKGKKKEVKEEKKKLKTSFSEYVKGLEKKLETEEERYKKLSKNSKEIIRINSIPQLDSYERVQEWLKIPNITAKDAEDVIEFFESGELGIKKQTESELIDLRGEIKERDFKKSRKIEEVETDPEEEEEPSISKVQVKKITKALKEAVKDYTEKLSGPQTRQKIIDRADGLKELVEYYFGVKKKLKLLDNKQYQKTSDYRDYSQALSKLEEIRKRYEELEKELPELSGDLSERARQIEKTFKSKLGYYEDERDKLDDEDIEELEIEIKELENYISELETSGEAGRLKEILEELKEIRKVGENAEEFMNRTAGEAKDLAEVYLKRFGEGETKFIIEDQKILEKTLEDLEKATDIRKRLGGKKKELKEDLDYLEDITDTIEALSLAVQDIGKGLIGGSHCCPCRYFKGGQSIYSNDIDDRENGFDIPPLVEFNPEGKVPLIEAEDEEEEYYPPPPIQPIEPDIITPQDALYIPPAPPAPVLNAVEAEELPDQVLEDVVENSIPGQVLEIEGRFYQVVKTNLYDTDDLLLKKKLLEREPQIGYYEGGYFYDDPEAYDSAQTVRYNNIYNKRNEYGFKPWYR